MPQDVRGAAAAAPTSVSAGSKVSTFSLHTHSDSFVMICFTLEKRATKARARGRELSKERLGRLVSRIHFRASLRLPEHGGDK